MLVGVDVVLVEELVEVLVEVLFEVLVKVLVEVLVKCLFVGVGVLLAVLSIHG